MESVGDSRAEDNGEHKDRREEPLDHFSFCHVLLVLQIFLHVLQIFQKVLQVLQMAKQLTVGKENPRDNVVPSLKFPADGITHRDSRRAPESGLGVAPSAVPLPTWPRVISSEHTDSLSSL